MVEKAEDTIYQRHYVSEGRLTRLLNMKDDVGENPTKDLPVHNGDDVSIGTLPVEERMQGHQIIEHLNDSMLRYQRNYDFQIEGSEANALIKGG